MNACCCELWRQLCTNGGTSVSSKPYSRCRLVSPIAFSQYDLHTLESYAVAYTVVHCDTLRYIVRASNSMAKAACTRGRATCSVTARAADIVHCATLLCCKSPWKVSKTHAP